MLEAGEVIKQSEKEFLSVLPKDSNMFTVCSNIMNQIYWVNASLKSVSPINVLAHSVPVSDFDAFDIGEPAPTAPPSAPPIPVPQPRTSQTQPKKGRLLLHLAASSRWRPKRRNMKRRVMMVGMEVQVPKRKGLPKK